MEFDVGNLVSVVIGGLLVFAGQWFASRQSARMEERKWKQEQLREVRRDVVRFREERARPVFEALDRVAHRWDYDSVAELADKMGLVAEKVDTTTDEYKQRQRERKEERFAQMKSDIAVTYTIHDPVVRKTVSQVLWNSTDPDFVPDMGSPTLQDAYLKLEDWVVDAQMT